MDRADETARREGRDEPDGRRWRAARPHGDHVLVAESEALRSLRSWTIRPEGRIATASNLTLYCRLVPGPGESLAPGAELACVYKPVRGERPLDDFPRHTLASREVAAYELSRASGWRIVPPTILRDGPFGPGMVQLWVEADETIDPVDLVDARAAALRRIAVFDVLTNNADRKVGHLLPMPGGEVHGVDHGITFHCEPHLRTVLWGWRGERLAEDELSVVRLVRRELGEELGTRLAELLTGEEVVSTARRADALLETGRFPHPDPGRPAIPWPPY